VKPVRRTKVVYSTDDGLDIPEVGPWSEKKYSLVRLYDEMFSTGMKNIWTRVYIDLFAGSGKVRIGNRGRVVLGSPLLALDVPDKFDRYIFCEQSSAKLEALRRRVEQMHPEADVHFRGDCNECIEDIIALIPKHSVSKRVLTFCFVDPYSLSLDFETIHKLSKHLVDFLILLALAMDAVRNESRYVESNNSRIDRFLGDSDWRSRWIEHAKVDPSFMRFLADEYVNRMIGLGFNKESSATMESVRSDRRNLPLYHLAFFSRHSKGYKFWKDTRKYHSDQGALDFKEL